VIQNIFKNKKLFNDFLDNNKIKGLNRLNYKIIYRLIDIPTFVIPNQKKYRINDLNIFFDTNSKKFKMLVLHVPPITIFCALAYYTVILFSLL
jgi:hypothetical protein